MTFRGVIQNGHLRLDDGSRLPDGTRVDVVVRQDPPRKAKASQGRDTLARIATRAVATGLPDMADQHDHYAHGTTKRRSAKKPTRRTRGSRR